MRRLRFVSRFNRHFCDDKTVLILMRVDSNDTSTEEPAEAAPPPVIGKQ